MHEIMELSQISGIECIVVTESLPLVSALNTEFQERERRETVEVSGNGEEVEAEGNEAQRDCRSEQQRSSFA